ncbi:MAG: YggS family pyridoxal phosphate-dependent enzyme, partial [Gammaproteobacteria bacterium]
QEALADLTDLCWHFIGPLQTNKTRKVAEQFDWVHSIDRQRIAERLSEQRPANCEPLNVCIQVNLQDEDSKSGVALQDVAPLAKSIMALPNLKLRGLMAIPVKSDDYAVQLGSFTQVAKLMRELQSSTQLATLDTLSMGMSNDLQAAIAAGATIVRVGTGIFGPRQPQT